MLFPLVSIISVNYNLSSITCEMLDSLRRITYPNVEIIVVDNASTMDDPEIIRTRYPEVTLIRSLSNLGFAGGNNLGIRESKGKYLLFLNNDAVVEPDFLEPLVNLFEQNIRAGIASPKIIFHGTDNIIQYAGCDGINSLTSRGKTIGYLEKDLGQHDKSLTTSLVDGAAMMIPREVAKKVGIMPEIYFLYYEEHDWCEMIKRSGYTCHYVANATVYHRESMSVGKSSALKTYYQNRNRLLFIRRNLMGIHFFLSISFFLLITIPKNSLKLALNRQGNHFIALWKGLWWHLRNNKIHNNNYLD